MAALPTYAATVADTDETPPEYSVVHSNEPFYDGSDSSNLPPQSNTYTQGQYHSTASPLDSTTTATLTLHHTVHREVALQTHHGVTLFTATFDPIPPINTLARAARVHERFPVIWFTREMQRAEGMWYVAARACAQSSTTCFEYVATLPAGLVVVYQMEGEVGRRKMQVCRFTVPGTRRGGVWVVESLGLIRVQGQEFKLELRHERGIELRSGGPVTGLLGTTRLETELIGLVKMKLGGYQEVGIFSVEESVIWESGEEYAAVALSLILTGGVFNQSHHYFDRKRR